MKHETSAHRSDRLMLTLWDLIRLAFGRKLKAGPLEVQAYRLPKAYTVETKSDKMANVYQCHHEGDQCIWKKVATLPLQQEHLREARSEHPEGQRQIKGDPPMEPTTKEITGTRRTITFSIVGAIGAMILAGFFFPTTREWIKEGVKMLQGLVPVIVG